MGVRVFVSAARRENAAEKVSRPSARTLLLECVGEVFDDRIREEFLAHSTKLCFDVSSGLLTFRKRNSKQLPHAHIFHTVEAEGGEGVLDGFALGIEDRLLKFNDYCGFHGG
jgi:hypothetical protein